MAETRWITATEAAKVLGIRPTWMRQLCQSGRVYRAQKFGDIWMIPDPPIVSARLRDSSEAPRVAERRRPPEGELYTKGRSGNRAVDPVVRTETWTRPSSCRRCGAQIYYRGVDYPNCLMCGWEDLTMPVFRKRPVLTDN